MEPSWQSLGRLYAPDERDKRYPLKALVPPVVAPMPYYKYWNPGPILDQGQKPHCVGYAWKLWLQASPIRQARRLDSSKIYGEAQLEDEWPGEDYDGTSVRAGAKILQRWGYIGSYLWATDVTEIRNWVLVSGPIVLGTNWYAAMFEGRWIKEQFWLEPFGDLVGGHAWTVIGYSQYRRAFRCVNSWGSVWGQNGRFWLAEEYMAQLLHEQGEACTAIEIKLDPIAEGKIVL